METQVRPGEGEALLKKRNLWTAIEAFDLDGDAPLPFTRKLARDNGWDAEFAARVALEYKKFVFLAMAAGHPVSPSDAVDQAWHLHLCYTRSYWDDFCGQVLGAPLHHGPTRGGAAESAKFAGWYARTLSSYREEFGEPPSDIWPSPEEQQARRPRFRRVDAAQNWVVKKPSLGVRFPARRAIAFSPPVRTAAGMLALCVALLIAGDASQVLGAVAGGLNIFDWDGASFLALFWSLCVAGALAVAAVRRSFALPDDARFPSPAPDVYAIARLSDAGELPTDAALASMHQARKIIIQKNGRIERWSQEPPAHPWERVVWDALAGGNHSLAGVRHRVRARLGALDRTLLQAGLLVEESLAARVQAISVSVPLVLLLIGLAKVAVGAARGRPIGFLVLTCFVLGAVLLSLLAQRPRLSKRGAAYLSHLKQQHKLYDLRAQAATSSDFLVLSLALWGYSELDALGMAEARAAMRPVQSSAGSGCDGSSSSSDGSSSSCGSSDGGGSSCGSGCGGCGGGGD